jgi:hypothetical protein
MKVAQAVAGRSLPVLAMALFFYLFAPAVKAGDILHPVNPSGRSEFSFKDLSGVPIAVTVTQLKLSESYPYRDALLWGGDVGRLPQSVVSGIQIQKNHESVFIPLSAYSDLGDVKSVSFEAVTRGFRVSLRGGNTAASYDATLFFEGRVLTGREVRLRELPDERWEKSTYGFPVRTEQ